MLVYLLSGRTPRGALAWHSAFALPTARAIRRGVALYEGAPLGLRAGTAAADLYVVVQRPFAAEPRQQARARELYRELRAYRHAPTPWEAWQALRGRLAEQTGSNSDRDDLWSLMLLQWIRDTRPDDYLNGTATLGEAFLGALAPPGPLDAPARHLRALAIQRIFGDVAELDVLRAGTGTAPALVNLVATRDLISALIERHERIALESAGAVMGAESLMRAMVLLSGFLGGVTQIAVLDLALEATIAYVQFLGDLKEAGEEIENNPAAGDGVWLPFAGIFLPFASRVKYLGGAVGLTGALLMAVAFLQGLIATLRSLIEAAARATAALRAGFSNYSEQEHELGLFLPAV